MFNRTQFTVLAVLLALLASMISSLTSAQAAPTTKPVIAPETAPTRYEFTWVGQTRDAWETGGTMMVVEYNRAGGTTPDHAAYFSWYRQGQFVGSIWATQANNAWYNVGAGVYVMAENYDTPNEKFFVSYDPNQAPSEIQPKQNNQYVITDTELREYWSPDYSNPVIINGEGVFLPAGTWEVLDRQGGWFKVRAPGGGEPWIPVG